MIKAASLCLLALAPAFAQQPKFEIADVHVSPTPYWFAQNNRPALRDNLFIFRDTSMVNLIRAAYDVTEDAIGGGPSWLAGDMFDVIGKVPPGTTLVTVRPMLQSLLAERFALEIRKETQPTKQYVLAVSKNGSKLKRSPAPADQGCGMKQSSDPLPNMKMTCHNMTAAQIANQLRQIGGGYTAYLDHEVINDTKLDGQYDFELEFTPPQFLPQGPDSITLFDAVQKQLGLTLELKDVPVDRLIVAKVNRKPSPNPPGVDAALALGAPQFEVAVIKPMDPKGPQWSGTQYDGGPQLKIGGTLRSMMARAFQIQPNAANDVIIGLPKSADTQAWEITAKFPDTGEGALLAVGDRRLPPTQSVAMQMIRGLLTERFELKTHTENREVTVYALTQTNKVKLTKADPNERTDCRPAPNAPKPFPNLGTMVDCRNLTMPEFARNLEQATGFFDHPIVDATNLEGGWNFFLGWSRARPPQTTTQPNAAIPANVDDYMSSYDAVERQLGLKLVKTKKSIPVIVVDHVAEMPIE